MSLPASVVMSEHDARKITERIRYTAISARESLEKLQALVTEAQEGQAHAALGYASWTAYLADVLGEQPLRLPRDQRQQLVGYLAGEGMSSRAIASVTGTSYDTAQRDLRAVAGDRNLSPAPKTPSTPPARQPAATGAGVEEPGEAVEATSPIAPPARPAVTGLDGKTYTRPEPRAPKRRSLVDDARDAGQELRKALDRVERIAADDRLARNKEEVAAHLRHHLDRSLAVCQDLSDHLNS